MRLLRVFPILLLLTTTSLLAQQKPATNTATAKAVREACACLEKTPSKNATQETLQKVGTDCMTTAMMENFVELAKEYGYTVEQINEETGRVIGEKFGRQLATDCPASLPFLMAIGGQQLEEGKISVNGSNYDDMGQSTGTFVRLDAAGDFARLVLKTAEGEESFYWIRPFAGAENLEKQLKTLGGKRIQVDWSEFKKYVPSMKGYAKVKEITGVRVL